MLLHGAWAIEHVQSFHVFVVVFGVLFACLMWRFVCLFFVVIVVVVCSFFVLVLVTHFASTGHKGFQSNQLNIMLYKWNKADVKACLLLPGITMLM